MFEKERFCFADVVLKVNVKHGYKTTEVTPTDVTLYSEIKTFSWLLHELHVCRQSPTLKNKRKPCASIKELTNVNEGELKKKRFVFCD